MFYHHNVLIEIANTCYQIHPRLDNSHDVVLAEATIPVQSFQVHLP